MMRLLLDLELSLSLSLLARRVYDGWMHVWAFI
jgi:hypothetical protein